MTRILVLNAGSSSLKASVIETASLDTIANASLSWSGGPAPPAPAALDEVIRRLPLEDVAAVGHRIVHGGTRFTEGSMLDARALAVLIDLGRLAPLHSAYAIALVDAARIHFPDLPQIASFDSAFHHTLPPQAYRYAVPVEWYERWGIRRYGFHGLSVQWACEQAARILQRPSADLALVVAHLGSGCSVTAVENGRSVATSMGMTPFDGLMMATRSGSIDPGIVLELLERHAQTTAEIRSSLGQHSGLLGVSGASGEMRELLQLSGQGHERAQLAIEMFIRSAAAGIAAIATALPRLDGLVFTGGIGEHAGAIRQRIVARLATLGFGPITAAAAERDALLGGVGATPAVLRVGAREDLVIAREAAWCLGGQRGTSGQSTLAAVASPPHSSGVHDG